MNLSWTAPHHTSAVAARRLVFPPLTLAAAALIAIACRSLDVDSIDLALRLQARLSFLLFVAALVGPAWQALAPSRAASWLACERAQLFQSFAISHTVHGIWVLLYFRLTPAVFGWSPADVSGLLAFPCIALLGLLETSWGQQFVTAVVARRARLALVAYAWVQFVGFFVDRLHGGRPELKAWYATAIAVSILALLLAGLGALRARAAD